MKTTRPCTPLKDFWHNVLQEYKEAHPICSHATNMRDQTTLQPSEASRAAMIGGNPNLTFATRMQRVDVEMQNLTHIRGNHQGHAVV